MQEALSGMTSGSHLFVCDLNKEHGSRCIACFHQFCLLYTSLVTSVLEHFGHVRAIQLIS